MLDLPLAAPRSSPRPAAVGVGSLAIVCWMTAGARVVDARDGTGAVGTGPLRTLPAIRAECPAPVDPPRRLPAAARAHAARSGDAAGGERRTGERSADDRPPGAALARIRERVSAGPRRSPAEEVDRWTLRLAGPERTATADALRRMRGHSGYMRAALRREGLPEALIAIPLIESGFRSDATSRAGAAGVWQLMPGTARAYGLVVSERCDERRDPARSTLAATRLLRDLHAEFGSWHLAAAAYNAGSGRVSSGIGPAARARRGGDLAYWAGRSKLPRETREYVPRLLAAARIVADPAAFGLLQQEVTPSPPRHPHLAGCR